MFDMSMGDQGILTMMGISLEPVVKKLTDPVPYSSLFRVNTASTVTPGGIRLNSVTETW